MKTDENWKQVFELKVQRTRAAFETLEMDILAVRNKIAHSRLVDDRDASVLESALERIGL